MPDYHIGCRLNPERDRDIIEYVEWLLDQRLDRGLIFRDALRHYAVIQGRPVAKDNQAVALEMLIGYTQSLLEYSQRMEGMLDGLIAQVQSGGQVVSVARPQAPNGVSAEMLQNLRDGMLTQARGVRRSTGGDDE